MTEHSDDRGGAVVDADTEAAADEQLVGAEELVREDDTIIGRAFRWSLLVFVVIGGAIAATVWMLKRPAPEAPVVDMVVTAPQRIEAPVQPPPHVVFTDITSQAGIEFVHTNGAIGDKLLPETMGSG
ncbi:MAG: CRTAC1 family protein, partial [Planctomycetota bacterium]